MIAIIKNITTSFILLAVIQIPLLSLSIDIRSFDHPGFTRIVFEGDRGFEFKYDRADKKKLEILLNKKADISQRVQKIENSRLIDSVVHKRSSGRSTFQVNFKAPYRIEHQFVAEKPFRVVFDLVESPGKASRTPALTPRENGDEPSLSAPPSLPTRTIIETVCIDAGHGGTDLGAVGSSQVTEKEITLKVAKKLKRLIISRLGLRVLMTRESDIEVSLDSRVAVANNQKAQMFISIHVNGSYRKTARGPETFYVSLKATDQDASNVAQKENGAFEEIEEMADDDDGLKMILWNMAQNEYIKESSKLSEYIQDELNVLLNTRNRGVKQAPFRVLMRAAMPAVLVEVAFLSHAGEEKKLRNDAFLDEVAYSIYTGISKYIDFQNRRYHQ